MKIRINKDRQIEELLGQNYGITRQIVCRMHIGDSVLKVARAARPGPMRGKVPVALRRGWVKCVIQTHLENRKLYADVMNGTL